MFTLIHKGSVTFGRREMYGVNTPWKFLTARKVERAAKAATFSEDRLAFS
jgi:hypothetical protein